MSDKQATGILSGKSRKRVPAVRKWGKVSLRGRAQVRSHEPLLSFFPLFALLGLFHHSKTLGLLWLKFRAGKQ